MERYELPASPILPVRAFDVGLDVPSRRSLRGSQVVAINAHRSHPVRWAVHARPRHSTGRCMRRRDIPASDPRHCPASAAPFWCVSRGCPRGSGPTRERPGTRPPRHGARPRSARRDRRCSGGRRDARAGRRQGAPADMVVEEQAQPDHPPGPQPGVVREHEARRPDDMRGVAQQHLAPAQGVAHEAEVAMLQVAKPPMNELGTGRRGMRAEIVLLAQQHIEAASRAMPVPLMPPPMTRRSTVFSSMSLTTIRTGPLGRRARVGVASRSEWVRVSWDKTR